MSLESGLNFGLALNKQWDERERYQEELAWRKEQQAQQRLQWADQAASRTAAQGAADARIQELDDAGRMGIDAEEMGLKAPMVPNYVMQNDGQGGAPELAKSNIAMSDIQRQKLQNQKALLKIGRSDPGLTLKGLESSSNSVLTARRTALESHLMTMPDGDFNDMLQKVSDSKAQKWEVVDDAKNPGMKTLQLGDKSESMSRPQLAKFVGAMYAMRNGDEAAIDKIEGISDKMKAAAKESFTQGLGIAKLSNDNAKDGATIGLTKAHTTYYDKAGNALETKAANSGSARGSAATDKDWAKYMTPPKGVMDVDDPTGGKPIQMEALGGVYRSLMDKGYQEGLTIQGAMANASAGVEKLKAEAKKSMEALNAEAKTPGEKLTYQQVIERAIEFKSRPPADPQQGAAPKPNVQQPPAKPKVQKSDLVKDAPPATPGLDVSSRDAKMKAAYQAFLDAQPSWFAQRTPTSEAALKAAEEEYTRFVKDSAYKGR